MVTGGCSGIGKIMARKGLERGVSKLIIIDINESALVQTKSEFSNWEKEILIYPCNLADVTQIREVSEKIKNEVGNVDILINNADVVTGKYFHEHTHEI